MRTRARASHERGRQHWPAAEYAEYRLALEAPGEFAALVIDEGAGRFALGPLTEVAASTHTWDEMAPHLDHVVLFSGDGDLRLLVEAVLRKGVRVSVVSTIRSQPPMVADELRRQADNFIELGELTDSIARTHHPRATPADPDADLAETA